MKKQAEAPAANALELTRVADLMKPRPPAVLSTARFAEIARVFLTERVSNVYVTEPKGRFLGAVSLHDIKPYLSEPDLAELVTARDILRDDFPQVAPGQPLAQALGGFLSFDGERLPVVEADGTLAGSLAKGDLLLALVERQKRPRRPRPMGEAPGPARPRAGAGGGVHRFVAVTSWIRNKARLTCFR